MSRPHAGEALGFGFDQGWKVVAADGALLLKMLSNGRHAVVRQDFAKHAAAGVGGRLESEGEGDKGRMRREDGVRVLAAVAGATQPQVCVRIIHAGADRIEVDVAMAVQHIASAIDQTGLVTTISQCATVPMADIELRNVAASEFLHEADDCTSCWRRGQQVSVVVLRHIGRSTQPVSSTAMRNSVR